MPLDDNDDDDNVDADDDDDDDDEDHSLAAPEMNYRWDTSDLEHSRFALDGVKRAGPITFHRSFSLSAPCRSRSGLNVFDPGPPRRRKNSAGTPPHARRYTFASASVRTKYHARVYFAKQRTRKRRYVMNGGTVPLFSSLLVLSLARPLRLLRDA